jgi:hypothetical protein
MLNEATYPVASRGLATAFAEAELPATYAAQILNRFLNARGGYEKRQGMEQLGSRVPFAPLLTGIHELVDKEGNQTLFVSGNGTVYSFDGTSYSAVYSFGSNTARISSLQFDDKLVFYNGVDRNVYTTDGVAFQELIALIEEGLTSSGANATTLTDADITNWVSQTDVAPNDLVYNTTLNAYGLITAVTTAAVTHSTIGSAASGIGTATRNQGANDGYQIIDLVELNIVTAGATLDNVAVLGAGSSTTVVAVSGVNFASTEIRTGDIIYNTTRNAVTRVTTVSANVNVVSINGQVPGDSITLFKSAMPISTCIHAHYGRAYHIDARDQRKVRISGANDIEDMTTDAGTLDGITFNAGALQPVGEIFLWLTSFQRFLVIGGRRNMFVYQGTTPIGTDADFAPVGLFPQGLASARGMISIGNDVLFTTNDGVQALSVIDDQSNLTRGNVSEAIRPTLRELIDATPQEQIIATHYPGRSWFLLKVGSVIFNYTYSTAGQNAQGRSLPGGWSQFDGLFAQCQAYFVRQTGELICAGAGGLVYQFDTGVYSDAGQTFGTIYQTGWLSLEDPRRTVRRKQIHYIKPIIEAARSVYSVEAEAPFDAETTDTITVSATGASAPIGIGVVGETTIGGSSIQNVKYPIRVRGEVVRMTFTTNDANGPDILSRYTLYYNMLGKA